MQPLKLNQKFLTLVNLCAPPDNVTRSKILLHAIVGIYVFGTLCTDLISSSSFLLQYKKRDLVDVLGSVLQVAAVSSIIFGMTTVFVIGKRLRRIFSLFQKIYNECANDSSFGFFTRINQLCTKVTRILVVKYVLGYYVLSVTLALVNVTFCYIKEGDGIDTLCLYTPYKHILPWNDDTFLGWFYGLLCSFWMSGTYFLMNSIFLSFFLATSMNFYAFQQQFNAILSPINETNAQQNHFNQNAKQILQRAIRFHCFILAALPPI